MAEIQPSVLNLLSQVSRQAAMIVLLMYLGHLPTIPEMEKILGMERRAISAHLLRLEQLGLIRYIGRAWGYAIDLPLSAENKRLLALFVPNHTVLAQIGYENTPNPPLITSTINHPLIKEDELIVEVINKPENVRNTYSELPLKASSGAKNVPPEGCSPELWQALGEMHIGGKKRRSLALRPDLTPQLVRLWEQYLRQEKGEGYTVGLLIHVLESGDPAPATNELGHLESCTCEQCERFKYLRCIYCHKYPCICGRNPMEDFRSSQDGDEWEEDEVDDDGSEEDQVGKEPEQASSAAPFAV